MSDAWIPNYDRRWPDDRTNTKFGYAPDVDLATDPTDIWVASDGAQADIYFPTAAAATTVVSANAADDDEGSGVQQVRLYGLVVDSDGRLQQQTVDASTTGGGSTALSVQLARCDRFQAIAWGAGGENAGNIDVRHGANILARIGLVYGTGANQTLQLGYTVPEVRENGATVKRAVMAGWLAAAGKGGAASCAIAIMTKPWASSEWTIKEIHDVHSQGGPFHHMYPLWRRYDPGTDIKFRVLEVSANDMAISGAFDVFLEEE